MKKKFDLSQLTKRERHFLITGGMILLLLVVYFFIWTPYRSALENLRESSVLEQRINQSIKVSLYQMQQLKSQGVAIQAIEKENLLPVLKELILKEKLTPYLMDIQEKEGKVWLSFKGIPFDQLLVWLEKIWRMHAIVINQLKVKKDMISGTVQCNLVLQG